MSAFAYQLSVKVGSGYDAHLVNIQGDTYEEFVANLSRVPGDLAAAASAAIAHLSGAGAVAPLTVPQPAAVAAPVAAVAPAVVAEAAPVYAAPVAPVVAAPVAAPVAAVVAQPVGPAGAAPICAHNLPMQYRTAKPGAQKQWKAWMCATPKGTPDQCQAIWL